MDLSTVKATKRTVDILHPSTQEPTGLKITILPESDKKVKAAQRRNLDEQLGSRKSKMTASQIEENTSNVLVAAVDSWEWTGDASFKGGKPDCTPDNIRELFKEVTWIKDQVREEFDNAEAFFQA